VEIVEGLRRGRPQAQVHPLGQGVDVRGVDQLPVLEAHRQGQQPQHAVGQGFAVDPQGLHAPGIGMDGLDALVEALLMIVVLPLEVLWTQ